MGGRDDTGRGPVSREGGENGTGVAVSRDVERDVTSENRDADGPVLGANLNGRPHRLLDKMELIDASDTTWVRAFIDVRRKMTDGADPERDPDVLALRTVAREMDCRLIVSLKWDFSGVWGDKPPVNVPAPGSEREEELYRCASRYLESIGVPIDVVVLGNEPMWETLDEDIKVDDPPIVRFSRDLKDHLVRYGDHGDPRYLVGSLNRIHQADVREGEFSHFYRRTLDAVREDEDIDGLDLHVHYRSFAEAEEMVAVAREAVPEGTIAVTEFSPVWRYRRHVDTPITRSEAGERFATDYGLPAETTVVEYFEYAKRNPRPAEEVAAFYDAMPWYNVDHVEDAYALFSKHDVSVGTFGFLAGVGMRNEDWRKNWTPFHINSLFQPVLIETGAGIENTANLHYLEDYRERASPGGPHVSR